MYSNEIDWDVIEAAGALTLFKRLREQSIVELRYLVKEKVNKKMIRYVKSLVTTDNYFVFKEQLRPNALRQHQLLEQLKTTPRETVPFYRENSLKYAFKDG